MKHIACNTEQSANSSVKLIFNSVIHIFVQQNESKCETIYIKISSAFKFAFMKFKLIFIMFTRELVLKQEHDMIAGLLQYLTAYNLYSVIQISVQ